MFPAIVIDTREQTPFPLSEYATLRGTLPTGDYSLVGFETRIAVERKSKQDAYQCVGQERERFIRCLERLGAMERACVVIECWPHEFLTPPEYTKISRASAMGSYMSWSARYGIPVYWFPRAAGKSKTNLAERATVRFLQEAYEFLQRGCILSAGAQPASGRVELAVTA